MTSDWNDLIFGARWSSAATVWVEDATELSWARLNELAASIQALVEDCLPARVVRIRSSSKWGCFAGQLAAWRAGCVPIADDGTLGPDALALVRPDLTIAVSEAGQPVLESMVGANQRLPGARLPADVVAVNFTSGSTGNRKAVAVTRQNLLAVLDCPELAVPVDGRLTAASFATAAFDGWWFDTWFPVAAGGSVVCLPNVNEDVFSWPELVEKYDVDRVLLPAAVLATLVDAVPEAVASFRWIFSGGEQFRPTTCQRARAAGLRSRFVNLYGPTEATFATHSYQLPESPAEAPIPIGRPVTGCEQLLADRGGGRQELVVTGPLVCLGYLADGRLAQRFDSAAAVPSYPTGDTVEVDPHGNLIFTGRLDSQLKVNGIRVDAAALERAVTQLPEVADCRVAQRDGRAVAFVQLGTATGSQSSALPRIEAVVRRHSAAITVRLVSRFPTKNGGKVDTAALFEQSDSDEG